MTCQIKGNTQGFLKILLKAICISRVFSNKFKQVGCVFFWDTLYTYVFPRPHILNILDEIMQSFCIILPNILDEIMQFFCNILSNILLVSFSSFFTNHITVLYLAFCCHHYIPATPVVVYRHSVFNGNIINIASSPDEQFGVSWW